MDPKLLEYIENWGSNVPAMIEVAESDAERFSNVENGYNNTHEALYFMRLAGLHLLCAKLNCERDSDFNAAHDELHCIGDLIQDICTDDNFVEEFRSKTQMEKRFKRVNKYLMF